MSPDIEIVKHIYGETIKWYLVKIGADYLVLPEQEVKCPFCGSKMLLHAVHPYWQTGFAFNHVDVHMKCYKCGFFAIFGLAIDNETYKKLDQSRLTRRVLKWEIYEIYKLKEIRERLKKLEYW